MDHPYKYSRWYPFLKILVFFMLGIMFSQILPLEHIIPVIILSFLGVLTFLIIPGKYYIYKSFSIYLLFFILGICRHQIENPNFQTRHYSHLLSPISGESICWGKLKSISKSSIFVSLHQVNSSACQGKIKLIDLSGHLNPDDAGKDIYFKAQIQEIPSPDNPYLFDAKKYYFFKHITHQAFINADNYYLSTVPRPSLISNFKNQTQADILNSFSDPEVAGLLLTFITGSKDLLTEKTEEQFRKTGQLHLLAISGLHLGILYLVLITIFRPVLHLKKARWLAFIAIALTLWAFAFFTGGKSSTQRAAFMFTVFLIAQLSGRKYFSFNILCLIALLLLFWDPFLLWDVGFQLSFVAMAGILLLYKSLYGICKPPGRLLQYPVQVMLVSLCAVLTTLPLVIYYFHMIAPLAIVYSPLSILITTFLLPSAFLWMVFRDLPLMGELLRETTQLFTELLLNTLRYCEEYLNVVLDHIWLKGWQILLMIGFLLLLSWCLSKFNFIRLISACLLLAIFFFVTDIFSWKDHEDQLVLSIYAHKNGWILDFFDGHKCYQVSEGKIDSSYLAYVTSNNRNAHHIREVELSKEIDHSHLYYADGILLLGGGNFFLEHPGNNYTLAHINNIDKARLIANQDQTGDLEYHPAGFKTLKLKDRNFWQFNLRK